MSTRHSFLSTTGLIRSSSSSSNLSSFQAPSRGTRTGKRSFIRHLISREDNTNTNAPSPTVKKLAVRAGIIPLGPTFLVVIAMLFSLFFVACVCFSFIGYEYDPEFRDILNEVSKTSPGIVLVGDNVDVDVDEPALTIRWSILACGSDFMLAGSEGTHGSDACGIPSSVLDIFVDNILTASYDPASIPTISSTGKKRSIQNLFQFDSDHVLDVHEAHLYPFDTYHLTSTLRVVDRTTNTTVPLIRAPTITQVSSFRVAPTDVASSVNISTSEPQAPSRDIDLVIKRPGEAKLFTLLLFAVNWMLAHATVGYLVLAWKSEDTERILKYLAYVAVTLLLIPQLRGAMPDAPGYDGVLLDSIGFFPQMLMSGFALIMVLAAIAQRELHALNKYDSPPEAPVKEPQAPLAAGLRRMRLAGSKSSIDLGNLRASFARNFTPPNTIAE